MTKVRGDARAPSGSVEWFLATQARRWPEIHAEDDAAVSSDYERRPYRAPPSEEPHTVLPVQFTVTDLFMVGIGFDLVGAWLLARGLLAQPGSSLRVTPLPGALTAAEDRIDGSFGLSSLLLGFGLQALGYALDLAPRVADRTELVRYS